MDCLLEAIGFDVKVIGFILKINRLLMLTGSPANLSSISHLLFMSILKLSSKINLSLQTSLPVPMVVPDFMQVSGAFFVVVASVVVVGASVVVVVVVVVTGMSVIKFSSFLLPLFH